MPRPTLLMIVLLLARASPVVAEEPPPCAAVPPPPATAMLYVGTHENGPHGTNDLVRNGSYGLSVWVRNGPSWREFDGCVTWSVSEVEGVTLAAGRALLVVRAEATDGARVRVRAQVPGFEVVPTDFRVVAPELHPLAGQWRQVGGGSAGFPGCLCPFPSGPDDARTEGIREFSVSANGRFSVTYMPFESYRDFWGAFTFDREKHTVRFVIEDGNAIPASYDGEGTYEIDAKGRLILRGISFESGFAPWSTYVFSQAG